MYKSHKSSCNSIVPSLLCLCFMVSSWSKKYTGLFISPSGISELDCATAKKDTAERSISVGRESLQVFFVLGALAYFQVPPLGGSHEEKMAFTVNKKAFCVLEFAKTESIVTATEVSDHVPHRTIYRQNNL